MEEAPIVSEVLAKLLANALVKRKQYIQGWEKVREVLDTRHPTKSLVRTIEGNTFWIETGPNGRLQEADPP